MNFYKIPNKAKLSIILLISVPFLLVFSFVGHDLWLNPTTPFEYFLEAQSKINVESKILSIYRDEKNHNTLFLKFKDTTIGLNRLWENKFKVGDSISKKKGFLIVEHYRNEKLIEILNYNDLKK
jgi:hypothetical protein